MKKDTLSTDAALIGMIAKGDEDAFEAFYDRNKALVYGLVVKILGNKEMAEEVTLDVFMRVWRHARIFQPRRASSATWVASIARHAAIDALRRLRARPDLNPPQWATVEPASLVAPDDPEIAVTIRDRQVRVREALKTLPGEQREALALAYFRGYSHRQIANALDRPLGSVKTHIRKAMQQLRKTLASE